jgi:hypothetical protein
MAFKIKKVSPEHKYMIVEKVKHSSWYLGEPSYEYDKIRFFKDKKKAVSFLKKAKAQEKWDNSITFKDVLKASIGIKKRK